MKSIKKSSNQNQQLIQFIQMKKIFLLMASTGLSFMHLQAQVNPIISAWLQNNSVTGTYYVSGNSTALPNNILVNCQKVEYCVG